MQLPLNKCHTFPHHFKLTPDCTFRPVKIAGVLVKRDILEQQSVTAIAICVHELNPHDRNAVQCYSSKCYSKTNKREKAKTYY